MAIADLRGAADVFRPAYEHTDGSDGYVSMEVSPDLAHDTAGTVAEARRLWASVDRPNLMIKVPGTDEGIPAITQLIAAGINVNITLLFSTAVYERVVEAYLAGLEELLADGGDISRVASVASFFVSRIDSAIDLRVSKRVQGKVGIANAKVTYDRFRELFDDERFQTLRAHGAQVQKLLWASTSTKNAAYPELMYVESLIGPGTVDTIPPATYESFMAHGPGRVTSTEGVDGAPEAMTASEQQRLYILSFDHRGSFKKGLMGIAGEPSGEERERISALKALIYDGFDRAIADGAPGHCCGVLVDEEFGTDIARAARGEGFILAMPVERSGQEEFDLSSVRSSPSTSRHSTLISRRCSCATTRTATRRSTAGRPSGSHGSPDGCTRTIAGSSSSCSSPRRPPSSTRSPAIRTPLTATCADACRADAGRASGRRR